ncbi:hypothetical protein M1L60_35100 [Actinoplanes sp. TRM 88003]|uniref:Secreted protein n=1 Tax=Paractinoplanes aksuensis TaxID=2939490 RepID=A0ABT1DY73_9ACTN|nr:hypothetical protein [Actinoplanes aksuensis]MCO8275821.1 hypothetical protein [Actinoplanes aksuensis]
MTIRRRFLGAVAAAGLLSTAVAVAVTPSPALAADGCTTTGARTIATVYTRSRGIELRANTPPNRNQQCAWGRILSGSPGDRVWVDRSWDGGDTWEQLSVTTINTGGSTFTEPWNDSFKLMRACGHAAGYPSQVACTRWW